MYPPVPKLKSLSESNTRGIFVIQDKELVKDLLRERITLQIRFPGV